MIKMIPVFVNDTPISGSVKIKANIKGVDYVVDGVSSDDHITTDENGIEFEADHFVGYEEKRLIKWSVSFNDGDWFPVGESGHKLFFTLEDPAVGVGITYTDPRFEKYLYFSCNKAKGKSSRTGVLSAIWNAFDINNPEKLKVGDFLENNIDEEKLITYYGTPETSTNCLTEPFDGQCTAWVSLLTNALAHQGFKRLVDYKNVTIGSIYKNDNECFLVKNWQFKDLDPSEPLFLHPESNQYYSHSNYTTAPEIQPTSIGNNATGHYFWTSEEVFERPGIPGQNNPNPASDFCYHEIARINLDGGVYAYFDPSYGVKYNSHSEIKNTIEGFYILGLSLEEDEVNGEVITVWPFYFRKNIDGSSILIDE